MTGIEGAGNSGRCHTEYGQNMRPKKTGNEKETVEDLLKSLNDRKTEIFNKVKNGKTEQEFQIGGQSFTEKEWDKLLKRIDAVQEAIKEAMKEEQQKNTTSDIETSYFSETGPLEDSVLETLMAESTVCHDSCSDQKSEVQYMTFYTNDGISCTKKGQRECIWSIKYEDPSQYEKVMELMNQFDKGQNLRFAADESFWRDFLNDKAGISEGKLI